MKNYLISVLCLFSCHILYAQEDSSNITNATGSTKIVDSSGMAKVYVIRSTGHVGSAVNLRVLIDDVMVCKVRNNRYALFYVQPGMHMFNATSWDKSASDEKFALKMPVEAGKTYYMSMRIKTKLMGTEIFLEEITYNTASPLLQKYKEDKCD